MGSWGSGPCLLLASASSPVPLHSRTLVLNPRSAPPSHKLKPPCEYCSACCLLCAAARSTALSELLEPAAPPEARLEGLEEAVGGYLGEGEAGEGEGPPASFWSTKRRLATTDYRRWPPDTQALLRRLCAEVAAATGAKPWSRLTALCLMVRLQVSSGGRQGVDPSQSQLPACRAREQVLFKSRCTKGIAPGLDRAVAGRCSPFRRVRLCRLPACPCAGCNLCRPRAFGG